MDNKNRLYFHHMDVIRFLAAFAIFFGHGFQAWKGYFAFDLELPESIKNFTVNMNLGVELFFFISGFLITLILYKEKRANDTIEIGKFFIRRALRIWPLYFALIGIAPLLVAWMELPEPNYTAQLTFVSNFHVIAIHGWEYPFSHFWSIAVEEQFYLIWPFIIAFVPNKRLIPVFVGIILLSIISRGVAYHYWPTAMNVYYNTLCRMDTLVIGAVFALLYERKQLKVNLSPVVLMVLTLVLLVLLFFTLSISWRGYIAVLFKKYLYLIPMIPITLHFMLKKQQKKPGVYHRFFSYLGRSSYGLYMIHNIAILMVIKRIMFNNDLHMGWAFWLIYTGVTFGAVVISFEGLEKPFLRLKQYFSVIKTRQFVRND